MNNLNKDTHLVFNGITKNIGKQKRLLLDNIDISLKAGECTLLSGKNGCGKSTLLRIIAGLFKPDSALINTGLEKLNWKKAKNKLQQQIMYLYQEPYMFDGTVRQNLSYAINTKKDKKHKRIQKALEWAKLVDYSETQAKCLSGGEKQRVALAQAWLKEPSILLLDEPTANMDDVSRKKTEKLLASLKKQGLAILIASHDPTHFKNILDNHLILEDGKIKNMDSSSIELDDKVTFLSQRNKVENQ